MLKYILILMTFTCATGCKWKHVLRSPHVREIHVRRANPKEPNFIIKESLSKKEIKKLDQETKEEWKQVRRLIKN